jgi:hypothetical protein
MQMLADVIEQDQEMFRMDALGLLYLRDFHVCGTPGCIMGFVESFLRKEQKLTEADNKGYIPSCDTYDWLGVSYDDGRQLCWMGDPKIVPNLWEKYNTELTTRPFKQINDITAMMAVTMLRNLANGTWNFDF